MLSVCCVCTYVLMYVGLKMFDSHKLTEMKALLLDASLFGMAKQIPVPFGNLCRLLSEVKMLCEVRPISD